MPRHFPGIGLLVVASALSSIPARALPQSVGAMKDPVLGPILRAERDGRLAEAETLLNRAIAQAEAQSSPDPRLHVLLNHLANDKFRTGHTAEAIALTKQLIDVDTQLSGPASADVAQDLGNLGAFYQAAGDDSAAGQAFEREVAVARKSGPPGVFLAVSHLAAYYRRGHREEDAKALLTEAVGLCDAKPRNATGCPIVRRQLAEAYQSENDFSGAAAILPAPDTRPAAGVMPLFEQMNKLNAQARLYKEEQDYATAESTYQRAIALLQSAPPIKDNPGVIEAFTATEVLDLAHLLEEQGRTVEAEDAYRRCLELQESSFRPGHPERVRSLIGCIAPLESLYRNEGRLAELEPIIQQALGVQEQALGSQNSGLVDLLRMLARIDQEDAKYAEAETLYQGVIRIEEKNSGPDDSHLAATLDSYSQLLRLMNQPEKAKAAADRAAAIRKTLTPVPPPAARD